MFEPLIPSSFSNQIQALINIFLKCFNINLIDVNQISYDVWIFNAMRFSIGGSIEMISNYFASLLFLIRFHA
jgi:hypothetical protein